MRSPTLILVFAVATSGMLHPAEVPVAAGAGHEEDYGARNPKAPEELARFEFLLGHWECEVLTQQPDGTVDRQAAIWVGRYALDGYAIEDEYRQWSADGELQLIGKNIRSFDVATGTWVMKWFDAMKSTWLELGPKELGGVSFTDSTVVYSHYHEPDTIVRITYTIASANEFVWTAEFSTDDGTTWADSGLTIRARRTKLATSED